MEVLAVLLSLYLVTVNTDLTTVDLLAFSGYKYVGYVSHRIFYIFTNTISLSDFFLYLFYFYLSFWSCIKVSYEVVSIDPYWSERVFWLMFLTFNKTKVFWLWKLNHGRVCRCLLPVFLSMIIGVVAGLIFGRPAYYLSLLWCCAAIFIFMVSGSIYFQEMLYESVWDTLVLLRLSGHISTDTWQLS